MPVNDDAKLKSSDSARFVSDAAAGRLFIGAGTPGLALSGEFLRSLRFVLEKELPSSWAPIVHQAGVAGAHQFAADYDAQQKRAGQPVLGALALDASLEFLQRYFATHGWGRLAVDASGADDYALIIAHLAESCLVEAIPETNAFVDPMIAGMLQGFFEYVTTQTLACREVACVRHGAPRCTFVLSTPDRVAAIEKLIGHESAEAIIARLKT
jgi:uncharacterized protein